MSYGEFLEELEKDIKTGILKGLGISFLIVLFIILLGIFSETWWEDFKYWLDWKIWEWKNKKNEN
jgi:hypothetical protein